MARRKAASKRMILPDPMFGSELLAKFTNVLMRNGKKAVAEKIVYRALQKVTGVKQVAVEDSGDADASELGIFKKSLDLLKPTVEVRSCRVGGASYQVPVEVSSTRGTALAMRWLVDAANARSERGMVAKLAGEILDVMSGKGGALKKREDVHKMAKANQAFAHFRW